MSLERVLRRYQGKNVAPKAKEEPEVADASAVSLKKSLNSYLEGRNKTEWRKINGFHPSYTNQCKRAWYLLFTGANSERKFDPRVHRILDMGHTVHERYYDYFRAMGILHAEEVPIKIEDPVPVTGTADGIINWGGQKLIEMKSIGSAGFMFRKYYNKPKDDHYIQAQLYLRALKLEEGFVIYENKDNQEVLIFKIIKDDDIIDKRLKKWSGIYSKHILKKEMPARPYKRTSKNCQWCDLEKYCWDELKDTEESNKDTS